MPSCQEHDLCIAVQENNVEAVQCLVKNGANINIRCNSEAERTPLHQAALIKDFTDVMQFLLQHGADIHARDNALNTPLHIAASYGHTNAVRVLITHGADVNGLTDPENTSILRKTPLYLAIVQLTSHCTETVQLLLENNANVNQCNYYDN